MTTQSRVSLTGLEMSQATHQATYYALGGRRKAKKILPLFLLLWGATMPVALPATAQSSDPPPGSQGATKATPQEPESPAGAPITLTLRDALALVRKNSPEYHAFVTELGIVHEDRAQARAAFLPSVNYTNQFIYTEGNGTPSGRSIANNGVHEYVSYGSVHEALLDAPQLAEYRRAHAAEALARAREEIASRGLDVTVTESYYGLVAAERKYATAQEACQIAREFWLLSDKLQRGGEVARSDVIKFELQFNEKQRALLEAQLEMNRQRLSFAVLLFPNFTQNFSVVDDLETPMALPALQEVESAGSRNNPQLEAAMAALSVARQEVWMARAGYLPAASLDYFYGIDANHFATRTDGVANLGYAATASLVIPVWNWGVTHSKVKQAGFRREQAQLELTKAQRQLLANLHGYYDEATTVRNEIDNLRRSADLAADSLRLTKLRYEGGEASVLELVDAQNTFTGVQDAYADAQVRYRVSLAKLQTLTGSF
jgi:outer membrane protein TolC